RSYENLARIRTARQVSPDCNCPPDRPNTIPPTSPHRVDSEGGSPRCSFPQEVILSWYSPVQEVGAGFRRLRVATTPSPKVGSLR
ncbi:hypothetical protein P4O66_008399, partial [Electrophorus voltai]